MSRVWVRSSDSYRWPRRGGLGASPADAQGVIKLGNLVDLTGPTSDQGKDIAQGRTDAVQYLNERAASTARSSSW